MRWLKRLVGGDRKGASAAVQAALEANETPDAKDFAERFHVSEAVAGEIIAELAVPKFREYLSACFRASRFDRAELIDFGHRLGLDTATVGAEIDEFGRAKVEAYCVAILADGVVDPEEDGNLAALLEILGQTLDTERHGTVASAREVWDASNSPLPIGDAPILLKSGEVCHHVVQAEAREERQKTVRVSYHGPTARVKIMQGVYYNVGSFTPDRETQQYEYSFGEGALCFTNKRILFVSPLKSITIPLQKIVRYDIFSDAIRIFKDTGKPAMFYWSHGVDRRSSVLAVRVIEELR